MKTKYQLICDVQCKFFGRNDEIHDDVTLIYYVE